MNDKNCSRIFITTAAVLAGFAAAVARADVYCTTSAYHNNGGAEVAYRTDTGFSVVAQGGGGGYNFSPGTAPGYQAFSVQTAVSGTALVTSASANTATGAVRASSAGADGAGGNRAQIFDNVTFHNSTGQPQMITVIWNVDGSLAVGPQQPGRATYHQDLVMTAPGVTLRFVGDGHLEGVPAQSFANYTGEGWISYSCQPRSGGYGGVDCSGTWAVPAGDSTFGFYSLIDTSINCTEAGCGNGLSANFGNTGKANIQVPQGVTFTSQSGALLTGVDAYSRKTHGSSGTFDIPLPLTGTPGVECRASVDGAYQIVVVFANRISSTGAVNVTSGPGSVESATVNGGEVTVNLVGLANAQTTVITLHDVHNGAINGDISVPISLLVGDTNGSRAVTASDISQTKGQSGLPVTAANFRTDVNANGAITATDIGQVKAQSGTQLLP